MDPFQNSGEMAAKHLCN